MESAPLIGGRLRDERRRLGLNQPDFAAIAGASKRTVIEWEKGSTSPSSVQLSALSGVGVDIVYVVTGARQGSENENQSPNRSALTGLIDVDRMVRIVEALEDVASRKGKKWPARLLLKKAVEVYNFLEEESGDVDDNKMERVMRLVVNQ
jgi:transcriptional regulator with XRE-family HTH domain